MKNAYEVLYRKEADLARVRQEIESLKIVAPMLSEENLSFFSPKPETESDNKKPVEKVASFPDLESTGTTSTSAVSVRTGIWDSFKRRRY